MARRIAVEIVGDASSLERAFKKSAKSAQQFNGDIAKAGKGRKALDSVKGSAAGMAAGFIGVGAATEGIKKSITAASDLNEEIGKSKVVFKDSSDEILTWSTKTANSLGISQRQALEASGTFGNMLVPMGLARGKAAKMSRSMVDLSADMASFNNASPEDTLEALRSGLAGESEPLRKFGVFLSDARLKEEAMRQGLYKGKGQLDANAKAQATYALILKDTKDAQGDVARTSDSWANVQRRLGAQFEEVAAKLGTTLLPMITDVAAAVSDWLSKSENQKLMMDTIKGVTETLSTAVGILKGGFELLSGAVGGNKNAIKLLIGMYATFKVLTFAGKISTLATNFGGLTTQMKGSKTEAGKFKNSFAGKAGVAGAVALAAFELSNLIRKIPGWDKAMKDFGASIYGVATNLGLIKDPTAQFEGKAAPSQAAAGKIRRQAQKLVAGGLTPQQAANVIAPRHPGMAKRDVEVLAGAKASTINIGTVNTGARNARELEDDIHKRARQRPQRRR